MTSSIQPIACLSDQQAGHVTRRPTIASKNSSQGLPQQLSNLQIRRAIKEIQHTDSGKIALATVCRVYTDWYWLHSLVHLFSQTGYRVYRLVLVIQPCTLASTTGYSVPTGTGYTVVYTCFNNNWLQCTDWYWLHSLVHLLQQLVIECTGWYWLHSLVHLLQQLIIECKRVTECTDWYWLHSLVHLLQPTRYKSTNRVLVTQPSPQVVT